ncbi:MAG: NUDIX hydrolase [Alphaproteobacteria bacterium]|nr:NUDIX hydrolase [Alphaproteobacteria bacterium]
MTEAVTGDDGRKSSAVYAYVKNSKDEWCILAAKRIKNEWDDEGGKMNPPMGHRHKYESAEDGAVRECEEESGIKFDKKDLIFASKEDWGTNFKIYLPGKTSDYKPGEGDEENTKFKWIPVSEIDNYDWAWSCGTFAKRFKPKK